MGSRTDANSVGCPPFPRLRPTPIERSPGRTSTPVREQRRSGGLLGFGLGWEHHVAAQHDLGAFADRDALAAHVDAAQNDLVK